jgi:hypothetical protein
MLILMTTKATNISHTYGTTRALIRATASEIA